MHFKLSFVGSKIQTQIIGLEIKLCIKSIRVIIFLYHLQDQPKFMDDLLCTIIKLAVPSYSQRQHRARQSVAKIGV